MTYAGVVHLLNIPRPLDILSRWLDTCLDNPHVQRMHRIPLRLEGFQVAISYVHWPGLGILLLSRTKDNLFRLLTKALISSKITKVIVQCH